MRKAACTSIRPRYCYALDHHLLLLGSRLINHEIASSPRTMENTVDLGKYPLHSLRSRQTPRACMLNRKLLSFVLGLLQCLAPAPNG